MYQNIATKVLTGEVRLSYVNLVTPRANKHGDEPKYSVTLLIPKTDNATKMDIEASMKAAYEEGVSKKWGGAHPQMKNILWDGDGLRQSGLPFGDECKGHWVITASTKNKPQVVDISNINCELAPNDIYSGMYGRVTINFFPYDSAGSKGVGCGLGNVMKTRDGEALSGGASAAADFADFGGTAPNYAPTQQFPTQAMPLNAPNIAQPMQPMTPQNPMAGQVNPITGQPAINPITGQQM